MLFRSMQSMPRSIASKIDSHLADYHTGLSDIIMSVISCQIGQCGNQLGESLFSKLSIEASTASVDHRAAVMDTYFHVDSKDRMTANALLVDMEPKVIDSIVEKKKPWYEYDRKYAVCREEGSGNNWAYGFNVHGLACLDEITNKFRKLAERSDTVEGVIVLQSLAGGTGSGVGSRVLERLRDELASKPIYSVAVLPRLSGEVILQYYNAIFSMANLYNVN